MVLNLFLYSNTTNRTFFILKSRYTYRFEGLFTVTVSHIFSVDDSAILTITNSRSHVHVLLKCVSHIQSFIKSDQIFKTECWPNSHEECYFKVKTPLKIIQPEQHYDNFNFYFNVDTRQNPQAVN